MVLAYYGLKRSEKKLAELTQCNPTRGTSAHNLANAARTLGFKVKIKDLASFEDIQDWLARGVPVIVGWISPGENDENVKMVDGHYSPVVGLDKKYIYIMDPEIAALRTIPRKDFLRVWFDFEGPTISKPTDIILRRLIAIYK